MPCDPGREGGRARSRSSRSRGAGSAASWRCSRGRTSSAASEFTETAVSANRPVSLQPARLPQLKWLQRLGGGRGGEEDHVRGQPVQLQLRLLPPEAQGCSLGEAVPVMRSP